MNVKAEPSNFKFLFLTSKYPYPADDGQKIPVAGLIKAMEGSGAVYDIVVTKTPDKPLNLYARLINFQKRFNPFTGFANFEIIPENALNNLEDQEREVVLVISPARLLDLVAKNHILKEYKKILLLNDAKWPMYLEALEYGLGIRKGGTYKDFLKGIFLPVVYFKEKFCYKEVDIITVQSEREQLKLKQYGSKVLVAPNAIELPKGKWGGQRSNTLVMQVNFTNRRSMKWRPFIQEIWPKLRTRFPGLQVELFGPESEVPEWVTNADGVSYIGLVDCLDNYLISKRALIMPLEHSTGVSNTALRGLALGIPTVITSSAFHGIKNLVSDDDLIYVADSYRDLETKTIEAVKNRGKSRPRKIHDWNQNFERIVERLCKD